MKLVFITLMTFATNFSFGAQKLALNWKPEPQFGGFYEAQRSGLFNKALLDLEILEGGSGTPTVQMLANGKVDYAVVSAEEILLQNDKNPKTKIVAIYASFQTSPVIIMTHAEKNFKSLKDVFESPGVLALQSGLSYAQYILKKFGKPKVKIVPYLGGIANFAQDINYAQQGFITSEPLAAEKAGQKVKSFLVSEEGFNPYVTVVAVRSEFLEKNKKTVEAFTKALRSGWQQYLENPEATNRQMAEMNKAMDLETFKKSADLQVPLIKGSGNVTLGSMSAERWSELISQMMTLGFVKNKVDAKTVFVNL